MHFAVNYLKGCLVFESNLPFLYFLSFLMLYIVFKKITMSSAIKTSLIILLFLLPITSPNILNVGMCA